MSFLRIQITYRFIALVVLVFAIGTLAGRAIENDEWEEKVIEHNCGQYNPQTKVFEFKTK